MSVLLESTEGSLVVDLFYEKKPRLCYNFLKLCKLNYYFFTPLYDLHKDLIVTSGDPDYPDGDGGYAINNYGDIDINGDQIGQNKYLEVDEGETDLQEEGPCVGLVSFLTHKVGKREVVGSQFTISLGSDRARWSGVVNQAAFGRIAEGFSVLSSINGASIDDIKTKRPLRDIRITHAHILYDPYADPFTQTKFARLKRSTDMPSESQMSDVRLPYLEHGDIEESRATYQALALELMGDLPYYNAKPSPQTLFVAKLNPITTADSLEVFFQRFGQVKGSNIISDKTTGKSLCYGFVEYEDKALVERAYRSLQNGCIIDGRKIVVDFSQSTRQPPDV